MMNCARTNFSIWHHSNNSRIFSQSNWCLGGPQSIPISNYKSNTCRCIRCIWIITNRDWQYTFFYRIVKKLTWCFI